MASQSVLAPSFTSSRKPFGVRQAWTMLCSMNQARQTRRMLAEMDGRLLADIGASPSDAQIEANRPFWDVK